MSDGSTAVAKRTAPLALSQRARAAFHPGQIELIRTAVASECSDAELAVMLELAGRYGLDPFAREIFAVKMPSRDGGRAKMAIMVARDGLLSIAQRTGEFEGIEGDVVRENDDFSKKAGEPLPTHSYTAKDRGGIVGAWCTVWRTGRKPTFFFANWSEYVPDGRKLQVSPWSKQESAMILKCAEATALRKSFSISGLYIEEEMQAASIAGTLPQVPGGDTPAVEESLYGSEPTLAAWLPMLIDALNAENEDAYRPAKVRALLTNRTQDELEEFAEKLVDQLRLIGTRVPVRPVPDIEGEAEEVPDGADYVPSEDDEIPFGREEPGDGAEV